MVWDVLWVASSEAIRTAFLFSLPFVFLEGGSGVGHGFWLGAHGYDEGFVFRLFFLCSLEGWSSVEMGFGLGALGSNLFMRLGPRLAR